MNDENIHRPVRVAVIGAGNVGATFAFNLLLSGLAAEIVLVDANHKKAEGEAMDLNHAAPMSNPVRVQAGDYKDCAGAAITVITAGANQKPGESRLDLATRNAGIFREIVPQVVEHNPDTILLVATNPVDVLSYATWKMSGLPKNRVFGSGTILDTARFRFLLSQHFGVDPRSVHAYIIGEHGDSEVPVWSLANIAGMTFPDFCIQHGIGCEQEALDRIFHQTRDAAYQIIERKGATFFAVSAGLVRIVEAILRDQGSVLSVSSLIEDYYDISNIYLSLPTVVDQGGVERILRLKLDDKEIAGLQKSSRVLKDLAQKIGF
jgi:L-lactate dehydrogenase